MLALTCLVAPAVRQANDCQGGDMGFAWNYGDIQDAVDAVVPPDRLALVHGEQQITWGDYVRRTNNLAANLLANGLQPGDKIAFYMRNRAEYSEGINAAFKARMG